MITVLGSSGFIGSNLVKRVEALKLECFTPKRADELSGKNLGQVIYCIGLTADFRLKPFDTVEAHVCKLLELVRDCDFDSLLYLSSTRVYADGPAPAREEQTLQVSPLRPDDLYNATKIMGEALVFADKRPCRVARLSNVYGGDFDSDNFLTSLIRDAVTTNRVTLHSSPESRKDYISIDDVVNGLIQIATRGKHKLYNLASGKNVSTRELVDRISEITGCEIEYAAESAPVSFPMIDVDRMRHEFDFVPADVLTEMPGLIGLYQTSLRRQ